jgi:hypothetical protein
MKKLHLFALLFAVAAMPALAQEKSKPADDSMKDCPMHAQHQAARHDDARHQDDMNHRGDQGMGFAQDKTTHHFLLRKEGGVIQVTANSADDKSSVAQIRMHLQHIAHAFQSGDFNIPMFVHDQTPPGVPAMQRLKETISYKYEDVENGGRVVITSGNADAVKAVQEFLRFQITEHKTGDAMEVK